MPYLCRQLYRNLTELCSLCYGHVSVSSARSYYFIMRNRGLMYDRISSIIGSIYEWRL